MMQKIQQDLDKVNVDLELTPVQFPEWVDKINAKGIPVTAVYFAPDHTDPSQYVQYFGDDPRLVVGDHGPAAATPARRSINQKEAELLAEALASSGDAKDAGLHASSARR